MVSAKGTKATTSHLAGARAVAFGASFVALSVPLALASLWSISDAFAQHARMAGGLFLGVLALVLAMVGASTVRSGLWYGRAILSLDVAHFVPRGAIEGELTITRGLVEGTRCALTLAPVGRPAAALTARTTSRSRGDVAVVPIALTLPADAPEGVRWELRVEASPREGPTLRTSFVLPAQPSRAE